MSRDRRTLVSVFTCLCVLYKCTCACARARVAVTLANSVQLLGKRGARDRRSGEPRPSSRRRRRTTRALVRGTTSESLSPRALPLSPPSLSLTHARTHTRRDRCRTVQTADGSHTTTRGTAARSHDPSPAAKQQNDPHPVSRVYFTERGARFDSPLPTER